VPHLLDAFGPIGVPRQSKKVRQITVEYQWSDEGQASFIRNAKLELVAILRDKEQILDRVDLLPILRDKEQIRDRYDMLQACILTLREEFKEWCKGDGE
jgi:hypothetical protein